MCERDRGGRQKKEKTGGIVDKKEICHSGRRKKKKKKTGSRQETWATEDQASAKKAQLCQTEVVYLRYTLRDGKQWLKKARKKTVTQSPTPATPR